MLAESKDSVSSRRQSTETVVDTLWKLTVKEIWRKPDLP